MKSFSLKNSFLYAIVLSTIVSGCLPYYYAPNSHNIPLLQQRGEARMEAMLSKGSLMAGFEMKGSVAPIDHMGIMLNAFLNNSNGWQNLFWYEAGTQGNFIEMGIGYFTKLHESNFIYETYGGVGLGKITSESEYYTSGNAEIRFNRFFIQPSIGYRHNEFEVALSTRLVKLNFTDVRLKGDFSNSEEAALDAVRESDNYFLLEPAITVRSGWQRIKFNLQIVYSTDFKESIIPRENRNMNFGVSFLLSKKADKPKS